MVRDHGVDELEGQRQPSGPAPCLRMASGSDLCCGGGSCENPAAVSFGTEHGRLHRMPTYGWIAAVVVALGLGYALGVATADREGARREGYAECMDVARDCIRGTDDTIGANNCMFGR